MATIVINTVKCRAEAVACS